VRTAITKSRAKGINTSASVALQEREKRSRLSLENAREQARKKTLHEKVGRLVLIEWLDSYGCSAEWQPLEGCDPAPMKCRSVGWLVGDRKDCKVIVPHISQDGHPGIPVQGCGDMTIPSSAILRVVDLTYGKVRQIN